MGPALRAIQPVKPTPRNKSHADPRNKQGQPRDQLWQGHERADHENNPYQRIDRKATEEQPDFGKDERLPREAPFENVEARASVAIDAKCHAVPSVPKDAGGRE